MNENKLFDLGLICGRFSHAHLGHLQLFQSCMALCKRTLILVSSAQESKTLRNPFSIDTRINVIKQCLRDISEDNLIIKGLDDLTNEYDFNVDWGGYVKKNVEKITGKFADLMVYGNEEARNKWFKSEDIEKTAELILPRILSATLVRGMLIIDNEKAWKESTPNNIHHLYKDLQNEILDVPIYQKIYNEINRTPKTIDDFMNVYKIYETEDKNKKLESIKS